MAASCNPGRVVSDVAPTHRDVSGQVSTGLWPTRNLSTTTTLGLLAFAAGCAVSWGAGDRSGAGFVGSPPADSGVDTDTDTDADARVDTDVDHELDPWCAEVLPRVTYATGRPHDAAGLVPLHDNGVVVVTNEQTGPGIVGVEFSRPVPEGAEPRTYRWGFRQELLIDRVAAPAPDPDAWSARLESDLLSGRIHLAPADEIPIGWVSLGSLCEARLGVRHQMVLIGVPGCFQEREFHNLIPEVRGWRWEGRDCPHHIVQVPDTPQWDTGP